MGPAILIDKSTFQSLSEREVFYLQSYYHVVYCPTLFYEILGDLKKYDDEESSKREIGKVSYKINAFSACFTTDIRELLIGNLLGHIVSMDGRPVLSGGKEVIDGEGKRGVYFDEQPEYVALRRWTDGNFSEAEKMWAGNWRNSIGDVDLNIAKINAKYMQQLENIGELRQYTSNVIEQQDYQDDFLRFLLNRVGLDQKIRDQVFDRWLKHRMPKIKDFAPYAYYCLTVYLSFYIGIAKNLIGTKPSNIVDLEYVLYMPFCKVFASTDKFHRDFSQIFLADGQDFVWGDDLKSDLKSFCKYWQEQGDKKRIDYGKKYGDYPPEIPGSLTCELWKKHYGARSKRFGKIELTPEREEQILKKIKPIIDNLKNN